MKRQDLPQVCATPRSLQPRPRLVKRSHASGWKSANFLPQERQLFGLPGGLLNDWRLMTTFPGLFVAGDALFASDSVGHAAATGHYAGRWAAAYAQSIPESTLDEEQITCENKRLEAILTRRTGITWAELNSAICRAMQSYCGGIKSNSLLETGLQILAQLQDNEAESLIARNPHELVHTFGSAKHLNYGHYSRPCLPGKKGKFP